jgi:uncharacterized protein (TIGR03067 family)
VNDFQNFQGIWQAVWLAEDGRKVTGEEVQRTGLTISGDRYTFQLPDHASFGIIGGDRSRNRGSLDFVVEGPQAAGTKRLGIYLLMDDELTVCMAQPGRERPTSFGPRRGNGHSVYLLRRFTPSRVRRIDEAAR